MEIIDLEREITKIKSYKGQNKDILIDYLNDYIEYDYVPPEEQKFIVRELIKILPTEKDSKVIESIFNALTSAFYSNICVNEIVSICIQYLSSLDIDSLYYAISIIGDSNLPNCKKLIIPYLKSKDSGIRELAKNTLSLYKN